MRASLSSACCFVGWDIQSSAFKRSPNAARMSSTTDFARDRACGENDFAMYAWPSASPMVASALRRQRFHLGSSALAPLNFDENLKFSSTKGVLSHDAAPLTV